MSEPVIKFMFRNEWKVLNEAVGIKPAHEVEAFSTATDLMAYLNSHSAGMIITSLQDKNDLIQLATVVKLSKKLAPNTLIKVMVINFSGDKQLEKAVAKLGIMDLVDERIQTKALRFKIDFMMKSITVHVKKMAATLETGTVQKTVENTKAAEKAANDLPAIWNDPIASEDDVWILKNDTDCKKILTRWMVKFMGPSPYVAQWVDSNNAGIYKFEFKAENNDFIKGKGFWFFRGEQKPEYVWAENRWLFTGSNFELFYKDGNNIVSRLKLKDKQLTIFKNSEFAKNKEAAIIESFDKDLVFRKEAEKKVESESVEKDVEQYKNLEGKGKTDSMKSGPLSGKGQTSHLDTGPMSMDVNPEDSDLSSDPLSMDSSNAKKSSFWKGKNAYEQEGTADLSHASDQHINPGAELGLESKSEHQTHYKNHNEAEKFDAKDIGHAIKKDGVSDNLKGKTSTDEIEGHLSSPDEEKLARTKKAPSGQLSGKSLTDELAGPLRSPELQNAAKKSPSELGGKSSTDKLPSHLGSWGNTNKAATKTAEPQAQHNNVVDLNSRKKNSPEYSEEEPDLDLKNAMESAEVSAVLIQNNLKVPCQIDDFFDQTIIFKTQQSGIEDQKEVTLNLRFNYLSKDTTLKCLGKVSVMDLDDEGTRYINVEISKENVSAFNSFMSLYGTRQDNINVFFKAVKGN